MSGVRADVGFFTTANGDELTYAVIANGLARGADFRAFREAVLDSAASLRKPSQ
jgi:D-alanyl-D-alanine carboxypeptidase